MRTCLVEVDFDTTDVAIGLRLITVSRHKVIQMGEFGADSRRRP